MDEKSAGNKTNLQVHVYMYIRMYVHVAGRIQIRYTVQAEYFQVHIDIAVLDTSTYFMYTYMYVL